MSTKHASIEQRFPRDPREQKNLASVRQQAQIKQITYIGYKRKCSARNCCGKIKKGELAWILETSDVVSQGSTAVCCSQECVEDYKIHGRRKW